MSAPDQCPRCRGRLYDDGSDLACVVCGWIWADERNTVGVNRARLRGGTDRALNTIGEAKQSAVTEDEMVEHLRSRGYSVRSPRALKDAGRAGGSEATRRRRESGTLAEHMTMVRAHIVNRRKPAPEPPHGTPERYWRKSTLCRCQRCRDAMWAYYREHPTRQMLERGLAGSPAVKCEQCGGALPARRTIRRRFCSRKCTMRAAYERRHDAAPAAPTDDQDREEVR